MKYLLLPVLSLLLPACTMGPIATPKGAFLGMSFLTKSDNLYAKYEGPHGKMEYGTTKNDETVVPAKALNAYTTGRLVQGATDALRTTESTKRVLATESTSRAATSSAAEVEKLRILNPVEVPLEPLPQP